MVALFGNFHDLFITNLASLNFDNCDNIYTQ